MDPKQISNLAKLFRDSGDQILNSDSKLTLSGPLLRALNDSFSLIADKHEQYGPQTFQVVKPYNSKSDVFRDLQLIHDFVQKTHILSLIRVHNDETAIDDIIDIGKFHNLKTLEIHRIPVQRISGIQQLRSQLNELICVRCIDKIKSIMTDCGNDKTSGFVWNELKSIDFSFNTLKEIDSSLEFAPWLQCLNLSHNQIKHINALKFLPHLSILNLSFNQLTSIPQFHSDATKHLQILILTNNFIEDISGVSRLDSLNQLDLSNNCLLDHSLLLPVITLIALRNINLMRNPLFCHPRHRQTTVRYLHKNTASVSFILDQEPLTKSEKLLTGQYHSYQAILLTSTVVDHGTGSFTNSQSTPNPMRNISATADNDSIDSIKMIYSNDLIQQSASQQQQQQHHQQRKSKPRRAVILEKSYEVPVDIKTLNTVTNSNDENNSKKSNNSNDENIIEKTADHLDTKRKIEDLRKHYGDEWLHSQGSAQMVKSVIGIMVDNKKITPLTTDMNADNLLPKDDDDDDHHFNESILASTPIIDDDKSHIKSNLSISTNYQSILHDSTTSEYKSTIDDVEDRAGDEQTNALTAVYSKEINTNLNDYSVTGMEDIDLYSANSQISDPEDNEYKYIVFRVLKTTAGVPLETELFLIVSDLSIKEKDSLSGKTITKWQLKSVLSCERKRSNVLHIQFDTIRKDKKERLYRMETTTACFKLEQYLRDLLSKRPLSEMNQTPYRCANCTTHFSRENIYKKQNMDVICPQCKSSYVIEIKESNYSRSIDKSLGIFPAMIDKTGTIEAIGIVDHNSISNVKLSTAVQSNQMETSTTSHNSIDSSVTSLNEKSSSCSKLSNGGDDSLNSNQSVAGSSTNCEDRDADFPIESEQQPPNYDSDVDILSNPSQSSIEILLLMDSSSVNSSRKHSEERRIFNIQPAVTKATTSSSSLLLLDNHNTVNDRELSTNMKNTTTGITNTFTNLTESSSSGSITDSICTSYEKQLQPTVIPSIITTTPTTTTTTPTKISNLNSNMSDISLNNSTGAITKSSDTSVKSSSMFGGLFQSTNLLMSRTPKKSTDKLTTSTNNNNNNNNNISNDEKFKFNYTQFDVVDHRLKLYFYQHLFEDNNEHLKCVVKCLLILDQKPEQIIDRFTNGIFVMSTKKVYILHCNDDNMKCDGDIGKWLKKQLSITIDRIQSIRLLPWKIGVSIQIESIGNYHVILNDIIRTDSFFVYLTNNVPESTILDFVIDDIDERLLLDINNNDTILYKLVILNSCKIQTTSTSTDSTIIPSGSGGGGVGTKSTPNNDIQVNEQKCVDIDLQYPILIVTDKHLYLTLDYKWLLINSKSRDIFNNSITNGRGVGASKTSSSSNSIASKSIFKYVQLMTNVFDIEQKTEQQQQQNQSIGSGPDNNNNNNQSFTINFIDEDQDQTEHWHCCFETKNCQITTFHAISQSWEVVFGVPFGNN